MTGFKFVFLRTARSFYKLLWYLRTYESSFRKVTKTYLTKSVRKYTSPCFIFSSYTTFFVIQTWNFFWWYIATSWTLFDILMYILSKCSFRSDEPPKFNQGLKSFNKDISGTVSQILKIQPHSRLQIQFSNFYFVQIYHIFTF